MPALLARPMTLVVGENSSYELFDEDDNLLLKGQVGQVASGRGDRAGCRDAGIRACASGVAPAPS